MKHKLVQLFSFFLLNLWRRLLRCLSTDLGHVGDQAEGDVGEGLVEVATHHADPGGAVSRVGVRLVQGHDVGEVGELGVLLLQAHLEDRAENM